MTNYVFADFVNEMTASYFASIGAKDVSVLTYPTFASVVSVQKHMRSSASGYFQYPNTSFVDTTVNNIVTVTVFWKDGRKDSVFNLQQPLGDGKVNLGLLDDPSIYRTIGTGWLHGLVRVQLISGLGFLQSILSIFSPRTRTHRISTSGCWPRAPGVTRS